MGRERTPIPWRNVPTMFARMVCLGRGFVNFSERQNLAADSIQPLGRQRRSRYGERPISPENDLLCRNRSADRVALRFVAADLAQERELALGLDALGEHPLVELSAERDCLTSAPTEQIEGFA